MTPRLIIEICPHEPRATACLPSGDVLSTDPYVAEALADCRASGDCEEACRFVLTTLAPEFRIVARNAAGDYENRLATDEEKVATCKAIYFDSERDFTEDDWADVYLVWEAAASAENTGQ